MTQEENLEHVPLSQSVFITATFISLCEGSYILVLLYQQLCSRAPALVVAVAGCPRVLGRVLPRQLPRGESRGCLCPRCTCSPVCFRIAAVPPLHYTGSTMVWMVVSLHQCNYTWGYECIYIQSSVIIFPKACDSSGDSLDLPCKRLGRGASLLCSAGLSELSWDTLFCWSVAETAGSCW